MDDSISNGCRIAVYDGTESLIAASNTNSSFQSQTSIHSFVNLTPDNYYIEVFDLSDNEFLHYQVELFVIENGVYPSMLHTDDFELESEFSAELKNPSGGTIEYDSIQYEPRWSPYYTPGVNVEFLIDTSLQLYSPTSYKNRNNIIIDSLKNNRVLGNPATPQYSINGKIRKNGIDFDGAVVRLYDRESGNLIETTITNNSGDYSFKARVDPNYKYFIIAFDSFDSPILQAVVHDYLDPILETM